MHIIYNIYVICCDVCVMIRWVGRTTTATTTASVLTTDVIIISYLFEQSFLVFCTNTRAVVNHHHHQFSGSAGEWDCWGGSGCGCGGLIEGELLGSVERVC